MKLKGLYQKTDSRIWYYQPPMAKGVRPRPISLGTKDAEEAVAAYYAVAASSEEQFRRGTLRMEAARYVAQKRDEGKHTPATTEHAERILGMVVAVLGNRDVSAYGRADMVALRDHWRAKKLSPASIASYFTRVAAFFAWATGEKLTAANPVAGLDYQRSFPNRSERYCTREERERLIATVPAERDDLALCLWLGFFAGLRRNEIVEARRDWIDLSGGVLHVRRTDTFQPKGKKARQIRMSPRLAGFLAGYVARVQFGESPYLLRPDKQQGRKQKTRGKKAWRYRYDPRAPFEAHVAAQGLEWVGFHSLRHTFGSLHAMAGTPLTILAKELGDDYKVVYETYVGYQRGNTHSAAAD